MQTSRVQDPLLDPPKINQPNFVDFLGEFWGLISGLKTSQCQQQMHKPGATSAPGPTQYANEKATNFSRFLKSFGHGFGASES